MAKMAMKSKAEKAKEAEMSQTPVEKKEKKVRGEKYRSKNYKSVKSQIEAGKSYSSEKAIQFLKDNNKTKFDQTLELHIVVKKAGLNINVSLPYSSGKEKKIEVADENTLKKLEGGKVDFDVLLSTADFMPKLVKYARILGPKGMMPNPKNGTLIKSEADAKKFSGNTKTIKTEKEAPLIHTSFGKLSQDEKELKANMNAIIEAIDKKKIIKVYMKSTMSPSLRISI